MIFLGKEKITKKENWKQLFAKFKKWMLGNILNFKINFTEAYKTIMCSSGWSNK